MLERKMRPRPRLRFWPTQRPCYRVSSSCTLYEVFGYFAWRSAPPRKRVTQSEKAPALRDREVPPAGGSRRGARLRGNGDRGTCLTEGESFTPPMAEYFSHRGFRRRAPRIACNAQNPTDGDNKTRFTLSLLCLTNSGIRSAMQALLSRRGGQRFTEALLFPPVRIPLYVAKRKQRHPVQGAFVFVGGDGGIRTHGRVTPSTDFESVPL